MATETASPDTREARAQRRWARRGASLPARFLMWLARAWPWAWRVRLDLILLFNLAMAFVCLALAHVIAPAIIVRSDYFLPHPAAALAFVAALAAVCFALVWAFSVSGSDRLREAARHGDQPGVIVAILVLLSLASWIYVAGASAFVGVLRHPITGAPIEAEIQTRLEGDSVWLWDVPEHAARFGGPTPKTAPSVQACASSGRDERDAFLCALARRARTADPARAFLITRPDWRAEGVAAYERRPPEHVVSFLGPSSRSLGEAVMGFASDTEPWKSRLTALPSWERAWDVLEDPELAPAFARSPRFEHFVAEDLLFGHAIAQFPEHLFNHASMNTWPAGSDAWDQWRRALRDDLMTTPAFRQAWAAAGPGRALAGEFLLHRLVREGAFVGELRETKPYRPLSEHWRKTLAQPARGPEAALAHDFGLLDVGVFGVCASSAALAIFLVALIRTGLGVTIGALAVAAAAAYIVLFVTPVVEALGLDGYDDRRDVLWAVGAVTVLTPLSATALGFVRGVRTRATAFVAVCSIWAGVIWLPVAVSAYVSENYRPWLTPFAHLIPYAIAFAVRAFAWVVLVLLARLSRLPLAK